MASVMRGLGTATAFATLDPSAFGMRGSGTVTAFATFGRTESATHACGTAGLVGAVEFDTPGGAPKFLLACRSVTIGTKHIGFDWDEPRPRPSHSRGPHQCA